MRQKVDCKISISRVTGGEGPDYVSLTIQDGTSRCELVDMQIDFDTFARLLTGQSYMDAKAEFGNFDTIGATMETKLIALYAPRGKHYMFTDTELDAIVAPHETDGWRIHRHDIGNYHKVIKGSPETYTVAAHRYVRPDGSPVL